MAEVLQFIQELRELPEDLHWFCPRHGADDQSYYYEEDLQDEVSNEDDKARERRLRKLEEADKRKLLVLDALTIFAYDGGDAMPLQDWVKSRLEDLMITCDVCIRVYHNARVVLRERLEAHYDPEEVASFMSKFDGMNFERMNSGLDHAKAQLLKIPPEQRRISAVDPKGIYAIFEALSCEPYLRNEQFMTNHFDEPFQLVQTKKKLRLNNYLPAFTNFLFSSVRFRYEWAAGIWAKIGRNPTSREFDWAIRKPLLAAMLRVQMTALELGFVPHFWNGTKIIVSHFDKDLITHSLRAMDLSMYRLTLDHLHLRELDPDTFSDLLSTIKLLLELSPTDFWDSMRSISPATIIEQVFKSPALERILLRPQDENMPKLEDLFGWIQPFLDSIKPLNQTPACRSLVNELIRRSQNNKYASVARSYCYTLALHVLKQTLRNLNTGTQLTAFVGPACVADMLELVVQHLDMILINTKGVKNGGSQQEDTELALQVVESALSLDCLALLMDREAVQTERPREQSTRNHSETLWTTITKKITSGDQALATHALLGARELVGVEIFGPKLQNSLKDARAFNTAYETKCNYVVLILERLADFTSFELAGLFKTSHTATGVVITLLSSDKGTREAAVELLKALSEKDGRREAIGHILGSAYLSTLEALNGSIKQVTERKIFSPMPSMIKLCRDVVDALCNSQDGILRTRDLDEEDLRATKNFWRSLWQTLTMIFDKTEDWSFAGHDKEFMINFCRDTMEFADVFFNHYSVFVSAIMDDYADEKQNKAASINLLQHPKTTMDYMVKWLRLRDDFLAEKIVSLVTGLLGRLRHAEINVSKTTLEFIEGVVLKTTRTKLSASQFAELERALEKYTGRSIAKPIKTEPKKAGKQSSLSAWAVSGSGRDDSIDLSSSRSTSVAADSDPEVEHKRLITESTRSADRFKRLQEQKKAAAQLAAAKRAPPKNVVDQADFMRKRAKELEEKKKRDAEAIARAKQLRGGLAGAGSALGGIGVTGKDHSVKGTSMMVSSDESEDDEDNGLDEELFGIKKSVKREKALRNGMPTEMIPEPSRGPVKIRRIQRSAKDMRARLAPDLSSLHKEILGWDYFHTGDFPPGSRPSIYSRVPGSFRDPNAYKNTFQPLLILEAWQGLVKAREENTAKSFEIKITSRSSVDAFVEVGATLSHSDNLEVQIGEGDIILFSKAKNPTTASEEPNCLSRVYKVARKKQHLEVTFRAVPGVKFTSSLSPGSVIRGAKIQSITTLEREYGALAALQYYDLCEYILKAEPSQLLKYSDKQLETYINTYHLNKAQAKAVKSALDNDAFTLIQGPPGSGKTKTIVAIVGALLSDSLRDRGTVIQRPGMPNAQNHQGTPTSKKLLVCAPSNAAVDELVMRFKDGIRTTSGQDRKINVVRLGRSDAINTNVADVTLEELVSARLSGKSGQGEKRQETQKLMSEHKEVSEKLNEARERLNSEQAKGNEAADVKNEFNALRDRKKRLGMMIDHARDAEQQVVRSAELERKKAQQTVLDEAHVICATLSGSGHEMFRGLNIEFETVVVDEAAQCVEMSALIPLKYGCAKCILVGDPKQLPPTVFSREAAKFQYEQSLFVRMQINRPEDVHLLDTQYRMHPEISVFPSNAFYDGRLLDGPDMAGLRDKPWHSQPLLGPYRFFDVQGQHQAAPKGHSLINNAEIDMALQLVEKLTAAASSYDFKGKIGIITPYKSQLRELKSRFSGRYGKSVLETIEFNTTDAFQGRESEVIIFSCVRASPSGGVGFLQDIRRMNVGLTRAKSSLWVLGNSESLMRGEFWKKLILDAKARNRHSPASLISSMKGSKASASAMIDRAPMAAPTIIHSAPPKEEKDVDVAMSDGSRATSAASSRRSSVDSTASSKRNTKYEIPQPTIKKEPETKKVLEDIEMKDASSESDAPVKEEKPRQKEEPRKPDPATAQPPAGNPGFLMPRAPVQQVPVKRRKAANPLLQANRPKKPKTE